MATGADVRDILELTGGDNDGPITKKDLINSDKVSENYIIPFFYIEMDIYNNSF